MTLCTADFELGTNGSSIAAADAGSTTAWDLCAGGGDPFTYSNTHAAHGTLSAKLVSTGSTQWLEWAAAHGNTTNDYGRVYLWRDSVDAVQPHYWLSVYESGTNLIGRFKITTAGLVEIQGPSGSVVATGAVTVATGQWTRLEYKIVNHASAGILEVKLFNTADSSSVSETITATGLNTYADTAKLRFGSEQVNNSGYTYYLDDIVAGALSYPGPAAALSQTVVFKRFYGPAQLSDSAADLYTVPAATVARVMGIHASNPSGSPVDLTLSIGADGTATRIYDGYSLGADKTLDDHSPYELAAGEKIQGFASSAATVNLTITGWEKPA